MKIEVHPADVVTVQVPFRIAKRGGRKVIVLPADIQRQRKPDNTLVKAVARAFRWKQMLESGEVDTIADLAAREGIAASYMTRIMRLTLLAPGIVEAVLDGRGHAELAQLLEPFPIEWASQAILNLGTAKNRRFTNTACK